MPRKEDESSPLENGFGFTKNEQLYDRVSDNRFRSFVSDEQTSIHRLDLSYNNYGEFLFVTLSRAGMTNRELITFFGYGFHEYRERWLIDEWFWHESSPYGNILDQRIDRDEALEILKQRRDEIAAWVEKDTQSKRGKLFEILADLTDEDGAYIELEDLGDDIDDML